MTADAPLILSARERNIVLDLLRQHLPKRKVRIFGSRATGTARPYSDLDLIILGKQPVPAATLAALREASEAPQMESPRKLSLSGA